MHSPFHGNQRKLCSRLRNHWKPSLRRRRRQPVGKSWTLVIIRKRELAEVQQETVQCMRDRCETSTEASCHPTQSTLNPISCSTSAAQLRKELKVQSAAIYNFLISGPISKIQLPFDFYLCEGSNDAF